MRFYLSEFDGLCFRVWGLRLYTSTTRCDRPFMMQGSGSRVQALCFMVYGSGFTDTGAGFRVKQLRFTLWDRSFSFKGLRIRD